MDGLQHRWRCGWCDGHDSGGDADEVGACFWCCLVLVVSDIDEVHTSMLQRSTRTATLILQEMGREVRQAAVGAHVWCRWTVVACSGLLMSCAVLACVMLQYLPMHCHWRLNERSYGALTGKNKKECVKIHGVDQVRGPCMPRRPTTHLWPPCSSLHSVLRWRVWGGLLTVWGGWWLVRVCAGQGVASQL